MSPPTEVAKREKSRKRILHAAMVEFAEKGFQGARIVKIAKNAGMNVQAIYYHFGKKKDLYVATIESIYEEDQFADVCEKLVTYPPEEAIREFIYFMLTQYTRHPLSHTLLIDHGRNKASVYLRERPYINRLFRDLTDAVKDALARGAEEHKFRADLDPIHVFLTVTSLTGNYLYKAETYEALLGRNFGSPEEVQKWAKYVCDLVLLSLRR